MYAGTPYFPCCSVQTTYFFVPLWTIKNRFIFEKHQTWHKWLKGRFPWGVSATSVRVFYTSCGLPLVSYNFSLILLFKRKQYLHVVNNIRLKNCTTASQSRLARRKHSPMELGRTDDCGNWESLQRISALIGRRQPIPETQESSHANVKVASEIHSHSRLLWTDHDQVVVFLKTLDTINTYTSGKVKLYYYLWSKVTSWYSGIYP